MNVAYGRLQNKTHFLQNYFFSDIQGKNIFRASWRLLRFRVHLRAIYRLEIELHASIARHLIELILRNV